MNSQMTINSQISTTEQKTNKLSKQREQEQNHRNGDHMKVYQQGNGRRSEGGKVQRVTHNWEVQSRRGEV